MTRNNDNLSINQSPEINLELICDCLDKIAKGIYYHHNEGSKKIMKPLQIHPIFLGTNTDCPIKLRQEREKIAILTYQDIKELPMHGKNQEIFSYQIIEDQKIIVINMLFYKDKVVSVMCSK